MALARRAVGRRLVVGIAETAIAAAQQHDALADFDHVGKHGFLVVVQHLGPDGDLQHDVLALGARPVLAHAVAAARRLEMLLVAVVDQGVEAVNRLDHHIAALAAIAAVRPAELDELLPPEGDDAGAAVTALEEYLGLIEEFHGFNVNKCQQMSSSAGGGDRGGMRVEGTGNENRGDGKPTPR